MSSPNIGILGTGDVGRALGKGFVKYGHKVMLGGRDAKNEKALAWAKEVGSNACVGTFAEAARFGELMVLATLWSGTQNALDLAGRDQLVGKVVMDVTNPLKFGEGGLPSLTHGKDDSGGEQVQRWLTGSKVVKAFNSVGNAHMVDPDFPGGPPTMFLCGNDEGARKTVADVCTRFGWEPLDLGGIEGSRWLEPLCLLWVAQGFRSGSWNHAFKLLRK